MQKRVRITKDFYQALIAAYRVEPGNNSAASKMMGCDRRTCRRGWDLGWPEHKFAPISEVIATEQAHARENMAEIRSEELARLEAEKTAEAELVATKRDTAATSDAIQSRTEEARTVRAARHNAMGLLAMTQRLLRGANQLSERVESIIGNADLKPAQIVSLFQTIASTARASNETAKLAIAMERNLLGEPEKIIGHHIEMTEAEAVREIRLGAAAAARAEARTTVVIDEQPSGNAVLTG